jgi:tripartite-type tricarboxylate transporter receptor subunit TctC
MQRRTAILVVLTSVALIGVIGPAVGQSTFPSKPIKLIVPFAPGGATDILARMIGQKLTQMGGQPVIVENRPGAGGVLGMSAVVRSPADGYTLGMVITSHAINMSMLPKPDYDITRDITAVRKLTTSHNVLVVHPSVPAANVKELIALAKSEKMPLNFASSGNGTSPHLSGELFKQMAQVKMTHVPYRGAGPAMTDLLGGNVQMMFDAIATAKQHISEGKVRALGVTGAKRSPALPDVPTIAEAGIPGYMIEGWLGIVAPAKTPPEVVNWYSTRISEIMRAPEMAAKMQDLGMEVSDVGPNDFQKFIEKEVVKWNKIVVDSDAKS